MKAAKFMMIAASLWFAAAAHAASFRVVAHAGVPASSISKAKVADLFLKKTTRWENGVAAVPADQAEKSAVRIAFTREVLEKEVLWIKSYWQKMIFSGRATPPVELKSDAEVLEFVRKTAGAVGYVADDAAIGAGVKTLTVSN